MHLYDAVYPFGASPGDALEVIRPLYLLLLHSCYNIRLCYCLQLLPLALVVTSFTTTRLAAHYSFWLQLPQTFIVIIISFVSDRFLSIQIIRLSFCLFQINGKKHWQHGGSMRAPPLPDHEPPTSPAFVVCPHHSRSDSGMGSADTSFTTNCPKRSFQPIHPAPLHSSVRMSVASAPYTNTQPMVTGVHHCCVASADLYNNREDSSASSDSQYSHSSNPTSVDSRDIDMRTPLHANARHNYMSNQVYI